MTVIDQICELVEKKGPNETVAGGLRASITERKQRTFPDSYFYMTELTNPVEAFYLRRHPEFRTPPDLGRKLARGTQLHNLAAYWFRELPDFIVDEGTVDGAFVDIEGVRGRIDYLIGNSIIEFKSKDSNPVTSEEVFSYYVNDLEQLVFYAAIHPQHPNINYLVFMENVYPYKLKAFKVYIEDLKGIQDLLKSRIKLFRNAIDSNDPSSLGRCRYYELGCRFKGTEICTCDELEPLDITVLSDSISLKYDEEYTKKLEEIRGSAIDDSINCYTTYNILLPRKHHMNVVRGIETFYQADPRKEEYKTCLGDTIYSFKKQFGAGLTPEENEEVKSWKKDQRIKIGHRWLKIKKSGNTEGVITPYIIKVNKTRYSKYATNPSDYDLAELGIICSLHGRDNGLICTVYPNLNDRVQVYEVKYKSQKAVYKIVKNVISKIEDAEKSDDILSLLKCPKYMNDGGKCPLIDECKDCL